MTRRSCRCYGEVGTMEVRLSKYGVMNLFLSISKHGQKGPSITFCPKGVWSPMSSHHFTRYLSSFSSCSQPFATDLSQKVFLLQNLFSRKMVDFRLYSVWYISGKLMYQRSIWYIWKQFQCILRGVRVLLANCKWFSATSETSSYRKWGNQ